LGLDLSDPNIKDTPDRMTRMYREFFEPKDVNLTVFDNEDVFPNTEGFDEMILFDSIPVTSICEHHFIPFLGMAHFLYIPDKKIVGASKPARLFDKYSRRPQVQERLAKQVMKEFNDVVQPVGTMIVYKSLHTCMMCRGIRQMTGGGMTTSLVSGAFKESVATRSEGLALISMAINKRTI
jgi:GTP cyclohydrolase I